MQSSTPAEIQPDHRAHRRAEAPALVLAVAATAAAGAVHLQLTAAHLGEARWLGVGFGVTGAAQILLALVAARGRRPAPQRWLAALAAVNTAALAAWAVSRTAGLGPLPAEAVGFPDSVTAGLETVAVIAVALTMRGWARYPSGARLPRSAPGAAMGLAAALTLSVLTGAFGGAGAHSHSHSHSPPVPPATLAVDAPVDAPDVPGAAAAVEAARGWSSPAGAATASLQRDPGPTPRPEHPHGVGAAAGHSHEEHPHG